jgi:pimeloyl-ACP methyl ester carboxylesterase
LIFPSQQPVDAKGAQQRIVVDHGRRIEVFVARSPGVTGNQPPLAYSLEFTGNATRAELVASESANRWGQRPVEVWVMNYPAFGASDGPSALHLIPPVALATYDALARQGGGRPIFICGRSLGTTVALYVAAHRPCAGMVLQSCPPLQALIVEHYGWWNLWIAASIVAAEVPEELNSLLNAPHVKAPGIFIVTCADNLVPARYQSMIINAYGGVPHLVLMHNAGHNSPMSAGEELLLADELDWLWATEHLPKIHE